MFKSGISTGTVSSVDDGAMLLAAAETWSPSSDDTALSTFDGAEAWATSFNDGCSEHATAASSFGGCAIQSSRPFTGTTVFRLADMAVLFCTKEMGTCKRVSEQNKTAVVKLKR